MKTKELAKEHQQSEVLETTGNFVLVVLPAGSYGSPVDIARVVTAPDNKRYVRHFRGTPEEVREQMSELLELRCVDCAQKQER